MLPVIVQTMIPILLAAMVATMPIGHLAKTQKDSNSETTNKSTDNSTTVNDKTNQQTTKIITIREGFNGQLVDGEIWEIPYRHTTTVEKTYNEKGKEEGKQESNSNSQQNNSSHSVEDTAKQQATIISRIYDGICGSGSWMWRKIRP